MIVTKINEVLDETQEITSYPKEVVYHVMEHVFKSIKDYIIDPKSPGIRLPHWGVIRPSLNALNHHIYTYTIPKLRADRNDPELLAKFKAYWELRQVLMRDKERRNYKKKFGSWHYK